MITGALTGIGRATAVVFAVAGANIVVSGRREKEGKQLEKELRELGAEAQFVKADVRHESEVQSLVDETVKRFGRLDVAVNNAGTEGVMGPITSQTAETYANTFETNVLGVLLSMKHELQYGVEHRVAALDLSKEGFLQTTRSQRIYRDALRKQLGQHLRSKGRSPCVFVTGASRYNSPRPSDRT